MNLARRPPWECCAPVLGGVGPLGARAVGSVAVPVDTDRGVLGGACSWSESFMVMSKSTGKSAGMDGGVGADGGGEAGSVFVVITVVTRCSRRSNNDPGKLSKGGSTWG